MRTCGIDLGTTNSCIVVVDGDEYRVVTNEQGTKIFPSVVYIGRENKPVVGHAAKSRMGEQPAPVTTIKRKMGSLETVQLAGKTRTPVEVSAMILTYLKDLAETQVGDIIDRAVVTVPAYFNHIQRQQTDEAARMAGFREVVTLLEPVAAALAYSIQSQRQQLRVFVYDLGGGTFDATVLEKDASGGLTVLSFGGDPYLGGDDVDARLAQVILARLSAQGYRLGLDLKTPADAGRYQRLKFFAELAKKELTDQESIQLVRQGLFEDQDGATVDLDLTLTRAELEDCCRDLIQRTIDASYEALRKDGRDIALDSIDEVIMVGGMSRMPLVQRMLAHALGRVPKVVDPDLIVGLGAAHKAAEVFLDQDVAESGLRLELRYPRRSDHTSASVSGVFDRPLRGHVAYLAGGGQELYESIDGSDRFSFDAVRLTVDAVNVFALSIEDADERPVMQREIRILHDSKGGPILASPGSVVTKPISVGTVDGAHVLFPENTALPYTASHAFETADQSGTILAPIFEADREVERLKIGNIPRELPIGTPVIIQVSILANYHIEASAAVPTIGRGVKIDFDITPIDTSHMTPEYVRRTLAEIDLRVDAAIGVCPSREAIEALQFRLSMLRDEIELELQEIEPKAAKLQEKLAGMDLLVRRLPSNVGAIELTPTHEAFSERLLAIVTMAMDSQHRRLNEVRPKIDQIREAAKGAWSRKDPVAWRRVNEQVDAIAQILRPELSPMEQAMGMAAWIVTDQVPMMRGASRGQHEAEIAAIEASATSIFVRAHTNAVDPQEAINQLLALHREKVLPLCKMLGLRAEVKPPVATVPVGTGALRVSR